MVFTFGIPHPSILHSCIGPPIHVIYCNCVAVCHLLIFIHLAVEENNGCFSSFNNLLKCSVLTIRNIHFKIFPVNSCWHTFIHNKQNMFFDK